MAVREGEVHLAYDTPFVYAEVNADEVIWLFEDGKAQEILAHNTSSIGKKISTKMVGSDQRQDITSFYKYPEGAWGPRNLGREVAINSFVLLSNWDGFHVKKSSPPSNLLTAHSRALPDPGHVVPG